MSERSRNNSTTASSGSNRSWQRSRQVGTHCSSTSASTPNAPDSTGAAWNRSGSVSALTVTAVSYTHLTLPTKRIV